MLAVYLYVRIEASTIFEKNPTVRLHTYILAIIVESYHEVLGEAVAIAKALEPEEKGAAKARRSELPVDPR